MPVRYVGSMTANALRTRARRQIAPLFWRPRSKEQGGPPDKQSPLPAELTEQFVEATWESLAWRKTRWLGHVVPRPPTDLFIYQEIVERVRPDWIIETGTRAGGRALFLASVCDLLDHGQVLTIDPYTHERRPDHARIRYLTGKPRDESVLREVTETVGPDPHGLVILGTQVGAQQLVDDFDAYSRFVAVGSYVVLEDTIVNGHPVWPNFGPGPMEAAKRIVNRRGDFGVDSKLEKFGLTFNPHGFLKRLR
jgi:cephalosporin hydroxylase